MKKIAKLIMLLMVFATFAGCALPSDFTPTIEPISVVIKQQRMPKKLLRIKDKDELNLISELIQSIDWVAEDPMSPVSRQNGYIIFQYRSRATDNLFSADNPYKIWIHEDKSVTIENAKGKRGTLNKEDALRFASIYAYFGLE